MGEFQKLSCFLNTASSFQYQAKSIIYSHFVCVLNISLANASKSVCVLDCNFLHPTFYTLRKKLPEIDML